MKSKFIIIIILIFVTITIILLKNLNLLNEELLNNKYIDEYQSNSIRMLLNKNGKIIINPSIVSLENNETYIIVSQIDNPYWWYPIYSDSSDTEMFNPHKIYFWIINCKNDSIYGPMDLNTYLCKRIELNIPQNLKLKIEV